MAGPDSRRSRRAPQKAAADAAEIAEVARRLAVKGGFAHHWARSLEANREFVPAFLIMAWSGNCYDAQVIRGDKRGWPDFSAVKDMETRFLPHPFLIVPLSTLLEDVWRKCTAMLTEGTGGGMPRSVGRRAEDDANKQKQRRKSWWR